MLLLMTMTMLHVVHRLTVHAMCMDTWSSMVRRRDTQWCSVML